MHANEQLTSSATSLNSSATKTTSKLKQNLVPGEMASTNLSGEKPVLFVDFCSGSGRLSLSMKRQSFLAMAIDHERNNHRQLMPTIKIDLFDSV